MYNLQRGQELEIIFDLFLSIFYLLKNLISIITFHIQFNDLLEVYIYDKISWNNIIL